MRFAKCAASRATKRENRLNSLYEEKSTVKDCDVRGQDICVFVDAMYTRQSAAT